MLDFESIVKEKVLITPFHVILGTSNVTLVQAKCYV